MTALLRNLVRRLSRRRSLVGSLALAAFCASLVLPGISFVVTVVDNSPGERKR